MLAGHHNSLLWILRLVARFKMDSEGSPGPILLSFERKLRGQASCNSQLGRGRWRRRGIAMSFELEYKKVGRVGSGSQQLLPGVSGCLQRKRWQCPECQSRLAEDSGQYPKIVLFKFQLRIAGRLSSASCWKLWEQLYRGGASGKYEYITSLKR